MVKVFAVQGLSVTDSTGKCSRTSTKIDDTIPLGFICVKTVLTIPDPPGLKKKVNIIVLIILSNCILYVLQL